jgi:alpha-N-arabinofuranosidase
MCATYQNPVIKGFHPDPSVCRVEQDYYLVTSSFSWFPGIPIFHSRDLVNWKKIGHVLDRPEQLPLRDPEGALVDGIYAPTIRYHDGRFYCVSTNCGHIGNFLVHADDPAGSWSDPIEMGHDGWDNSLFFDDDGQCYYSWVQGGYDQSIRQALIDPNTGEFLCEHRGISSGTGEGGAEGSHVYRVGDWYYLMLAEGGTHMGHMLTVQRSRSPWGPYQPAPNHPFLTHRHTHMGQMIKALGHGDLLQDHNGNWWVYALGFRTTGWICFASHVLGRETFLSPVQWRAGWPIANDGNDVQREMNGPLPESHPWPERPARDDFEQDELSPEWIWRRNPIPESWSLTERPGHLTLHGTADALSEPRNVLIGRRQEDLFARGAARLDFQPEGPGDEAGIAAFMDEHYHTALGVRRADDGRREVFMRRRVGAVLETVVATHALPDEGPVTLVIEARPRWYRFGFQQDDQTHWLGWAETHHHSTEIAWGWTGVIWCLYATGNGRPCQAPAHFDWYEYRQMEHKTYTPAMPDRFDIVPPSNPE